MEYSRAHRTFLEFILARPAVMEDDALALLLSVLRSDPKLYASDIAGPEEVSTEELNDFIKVINKRLKKSNLEIKYGICEVKEITVYVLVNTVDNPITKYVINYYKTEMQIFRKVLGAIAISEKGGLSYAACLDLDFSLTHEISKERIEEIIEMLSGEGWFVNQDDMIYLGIRSVLELGPFLKATYNCHDCILCNLSVFKGEICGSCSSHLHSYCLRQFLLQSNESPCCPKCKKACEKPADPQVVTKRCYEFKNNYVNIKISYVD